jgi:hypothetical protein
VHIYFPFWWNSLGPTGHWTGRCLVKFSEMPTVITLCSVRPHDFSNLNVPPGYCPDLRMYCLYLLSYPESLIHLWTIWYYFLPHDGAVVSSRTIALVLEVISQSNARTSKFENPCFLTTSVLLRSVGKEEGHFTCRVKHVFACTKTDVSFVQTVRLL